MLSEISQSQKDKYCIIPVIWVSEIIKLEEPEENDICEGQMGSFSAV